MWLEKQALISVSKIYQDDTSPEVVRNDNLEVDLVLDVLRYGYGARVKAVIGSAFPGAREILGSKRWDEIGISFTRSSAFREHRLDLLPLRFKEYLDTRKISKRARLRAEIDIAVYQATHRFSDESFGLKRLDQFLSDVLVLQESTILFRFHIYAKERFYVVSRDRQDVFVNLLDEESFELVSKLGDGESMNTCLDHINLSEQRLAGFFAKGIRCNWFKQQSEAMIGPGKIE